MGKTILFVLDDFHLGGLASFVHTYTRYLNNKGYKTIVLGEVGDALKDASYYQGSTVISLPLSPWTDRHSNPFKYFLYRAHFMLKFARAYSRLRKHAHIDAIHFNLTWGPFALLLCCPSVYLVPRIMTFYGDFGLEHGSRVGLVNGLDKLKKDMKVFGLKLVQWLTLILSTRIVVFSKYSLNHVADNFLINPKKITIIPGTINVLDYKGKRNFHKADDTIEILNISRFENRKGHDLLLRAMSLIIKKYPHVHLTIRGPISGEIYPVLKIYEELRLASHVTILYAATQQERREILRNADLFIMPSRELETFGLSMVEALASGVPVIGTPIGAIPEVLSRIDSHLITKSIKVHDIVRSIEWYISLSPKKKIQLSKKCREVASAHFDQEAVLPTLEMLYQ